MSALINIAGLNPVHDPAYRYKMPKLLAKVEGRGNGIKTVLVNVEDVALALKRDAPEVTKFFGCELGAQTTFSDRAIVNGAHREADLQTHLSRYIEHFVLCRNCRLPETHYKVKDEIISQRCLACGHKETVDMTHKLTTFILASYKRAKDAAKAAEKADKKSGGSDKKEKKEKKEKKTETVEDARDKKEKKDKKKSKASTSSGSLSAMGEEDAEGGEEEDGEVPETVFSKLSVGGAESETAAASAAADDNESDAKLLDDAAQRLRNYLEEHPVSSTSSPAQLTLFQDELRSVQLAHGLRPADRMLIYLHATFSETFLTQNTIEKDAHVLKTLASSEILQRQLLAAFEWLCGVKFAALNTTRSVSLCWKQLYEADVVDEEVFLLWAGDTVRNEYSVSGQLVDYDTLEQVREHAGPFVTWLETADEEGEEEDEEGEEGEGEEDA